MITTRHIRQHAKCLAILDMIQTVNSRIFKAHTDLEDYNRAADLSIVRILYTREDLNRKMDHHMAVKDRLVRYYVNNLIRLVEIPAKHSPFNKTV